MRGIRTSNEEGFSLEDNLSMPAKGKSMRLEIGDRESTTVEYRGPCTAQIDGKKETLRTPSLCSNSTAMSCTGGTEFEAIASVFKFRLLDQTP